MAGRSVTIEFLGNSRNLVSAIDSADSRTHRLGSTLKRIGKSAAIGFAGATIVAGKALWDMGQAAAEDEAAASQLARQLKNNTKATDAQVAAVEDWITQTSLATGIADDDLRPALARLATATGSVQKSQDLLNLGMDISAGTGKDLKTVTEALAKAQNGSLGGLSRLGVKIKDAAGETKSFNAIQADLQKKFAGATVAAVNTTAGKMALLKVRLSEAGEAIGYKLLPYAVRFANWMLDTGIPAIQKLASWLRDKLGPPIAAVIEYFKKGTKSGGEVSGVMADLASFVDDCKRAWKALSPFLKEVAQTILPLLKENIKNTAKGLKAFGEIATWLWNNAFAPFFRVLLAAFANMAKVTGEALKVIGKAPGMGWVGKLGDKLIGAGKKAEDLGKKIKDIPDHKDVKINVVTVYSHMGRPGPGLGTDDTTGGPGTDEKRAPGGGGNTVQVGQAALAMVSQVIAAIGGKKKKLMDVLKGVRDAIEAAKENIASILEDKRAWAEGFQDFLDSVFNADFTDPTSGAYTGTVDSIIAYQQAQLQKALQLQADIAALVANGLSPALLAQLQAAGAGGAAQIHTLATGSAAQIAHLNSLQAQTAGALGDAGTQAANIVFKDQLQVANQQLNQLQAVNVGLTSIADSLKKGTEATVTINNNMIVVAIRKVEKQTGKKLLVSPA